MTAITWSLSQHLLQPSWILHADPISSWHNGNRKSMLHCEVGTQRRFPAYKWQGPSLGSIAGVWDSDVKHKAQELTTGATWGQGWRKQRKKTWLEALMPHTCVMWGTVSGTHDHSGIAQNEDVWSTANNVCFCLQFVYITLWNLVSAKPPWWCRQKLGQPQLCVCSREVNVVCTNASN